MSKCYNTPHHTHTIKNRVTFGIHADSFKTAKSRLERMRSPCNLPVFRLTGEGSSEYNSSRKERDK